jgi:hypothetical protein
MDFNLPRSLLATPFSQEDRRMGRLPVNMGNGVMALFLW